MGKRSRRNLGSSRFSSAVVTPVSCNKRTLKVARKDNTKGGMQMIKRENDPFESAEHRYHHEEEDESPSALRLTSMPEVQLDFINSTSSRH